jgi:hypothetical protein
VIVEQLQDVGEWSIELDPATPNHVLDLLDIRDRLWATYVHTAHHFDLSELSAADLLGRARYCGVLLAQSRDRLELSGQHIAWWMGADGDGGQLDAGADDTDAGLDIEAHLDAIVFGSIGGIAKGTVTADAATFTIGKEGGDTRREILDTLCRMAENGPFAWRVNSAAMTLDVHTAATLWPTVNNPRVILTAEGGREGPVIGLHADLALDDLDGSEVRTNVQVDWDNGVNNGTASATLPSTYADLTSGSPVVRSLIDWNPKRPRPPTERWRKVAPWGIKSQARANNLAAAEINERTQIREEITAELPDCYDPWRFPITPGNHVFTHDLDLGLTGGSGQVYYRGDAIHPKAVRVEQMAVPAYAGGGHYLRYYDGSAFQWADVTNYVVPEDGPVRLLMNKRTRWPIPRARGRALTRRQRRGWYRRSRDARDFDRYVSS